VARSAPDRRDLENTLGVERSTQKTRGALARAQKDPLMRR